MMITDNVNNKVEQGSRQFFRVVVDVAWSFCAGGVDQDQGSCQLVV